MTDKQTFILRNEQIRANAFAALHSAPLASVVTVGEPTRSNEQSSAFHAICSDIARSKLTFAGKRRDKDDWKALLVSGHAVATGKPGEVVPGIEGEFVSIRESTSRMGVGRASSLIEYAIAYAVSHGVELRETERSGFYDRGETEAKALEAAL